MVSEGFAPDDFSRPCFLEALCSSALGLNFWHVFPPCKAFTVLARMHYILYQSVLMNSNRLDTFVFIPGFPKETGVQKPHFQ
jgi:hypothetical protein